MEFFVGDRVLFKKENVKGEVVKINSPYKVKVLSEEGFEINVSVRDLVKIQKGTDKITSYGASFHSKDSASKVIKSYNKQKSKSVLRVDLHIELLTKNHQHMDNFEIVQLQLNECYNKIEKALNSQVTKLEIIHGIGEGILKNEVHAILKNYNLRFYLTQDGGATEVYL
ncbi:MAG: Smr/MutS family protein [Bacteroidota bacterium]|nr:Smr/MutS family protein [Bacteroidota bacterium]